MDEFQTSLSIEIESRCEDRGDWTESGIVDELGSAEILLFEGFRLDRRGGVLYRLGQEDAAVPVRLGSRAIGLLGLLAARQGEVVSKDAIIEAVWAGRAIEEAALNVQVSKLRRILDQNRQQGSCIETFSRRGYCFVAPVTRLGADLQCADPNLTESGSFTQQRLSVVVLPFENLSRDPDQRYLADGISDDLTNNLSRFTRFVGDIPQYRIHLSGQAARHEAARPRIGRTLRPGRERPPIGKPGAG